MIIQIRQLNENDWREFSQIRLRALQNDPLVFGSNYEKESRMTEDEWRNRLRSDDSAIFALYHDDRPIGVTGVSISHDDTGKKTAVFWGSWLEPRYRGKGLSDLMYKARIKWAKAHPTVERLIVTHRASNLASKFANQKHGFVFTHTHQKIWHDGVLEDEVYYELYLNAKE